MRIANEVIFKQDNMRQVQRVNNPLLTRALRIVNDDANRYYEQGQYATAEALYLNLANITIDYSGCESLNYGNCMYNLGILYHSWKKYDKAETYYIQAYGICIRAIGWNNQQLVPLLYDMGQLYHSRNMFSHAEVYYKHAMRILGEEISQDVIDISTKLGSLYYVQSKFDEAEPYYRQALKICDIIYFNTDETTRALKNLSNLYYEMKRNSEANILTRRITEIKKSMNSNY